MTKWYKVSVWLYSDVTTAVLWAIHAMKCSAGENVRSIFTFYLRRKKQCPPELWSGATATLLTVGNESRPSPGISGATMREAREIASGYETSRAATCCAVNYVDLVKYDYKLLFSRIRSSMIFFWFLKQIELAECFFFWFLLEEAL